MEGIKGTCDELLTSSIVEKPSAFKNPFILHPEVGHGKAAQERAGDPREIPRDGKFRKFMGVSIGAVRAA